MIIDLLLDIPYNTISTFESNIRANATTATAGRYSYYDNHQRETVCQQGECQHGSEGPREACDAMAYGSIVLGLQVADLFPRILAENVTMSVNELAASLKNITIHGMPESNSYYRVNHEKCGVRSFQQLVNKALKAPRNPVLDSHLIHLRAQMS